jgi:hypothetical protein
MIARCFALMSMSALLYGAPEWLLIRLSDGTSMEGQLSSLTVEKGGKPAKLGATDILSVHSGAAASEKESETIAAGLAAIQGKDRQARDLAVEELTAIGVPVLTPLLKTLKDTDQHEPRPLYRLFERIMPSRADGLDRSLAVVRRQDGSASRCVLPDGSIEIQKANGEKTALPWSTIRSIAVRKKLIRRAVAVHSLRHCNQIEYLDTGVVITPGSRIDISADGFARLSWNEDGWASDPDGLKKPGSPAYKTNLVGGHPFGALIGRVGSSGEVFLAGKKFSKSGLPPGRLALAINDNGHWQNNVGSYKVTLTATDAYDLGDAQ